MNWSWPRKLWLLPSLLIWLSATVANGQGFLSQVRTETRSDASAPEPEEERSRKRRRDDHWDDCDDDTNILGELVGYLVFYSAISPFVVPKMAAGDLPSTEGYFFDYPYQYDGGGMMIAPYLIEQRRTWMMRAQAEYADDFNEVARFGSHWLVDTTSRLGLDAEFNYFREDLTGQDHDSLWNGDANVVYRFAQNEYLQMRSGIGVNWLSDRFGTEFGFNFTYSADIFPVKPWIWSTEMDVGTTGKSSMFHLRSTVGIQWRRTELYVGADFLSYEGVDRIDWVSGFRIWF